MFFYRLLASSCFAIGACMGHPAVARGTVFIFAGSGSGLAVGIIRHASTFSRGLCTEYLQEAL